MSVHQFLQRTVLSALLPTVVLALIGLCAVFHWSLDRVKAAATLQAAAVMQTIDTDLSLRMKGLQLLARSPVLDPTEPNFSFYRQALDFHDTYGGHIALVDDQMRMVLNTRAAFGAPLPSPKAGGCPTDTLQATQVGQPLVGKLCQGVVSQRLVVPITLSVPRPGHAPWTLVAPLDIAHLERHLRGYTWPPGWSVHLLEAGHKTLAGHAVPSQTASWPLLPGHRSEARSQHADWSTVLSIDPAALYRPLFIDMLPLLAGVALTAGVALRLSQQRAQRLARGIAHLAEPSPQASAKACQGLQELQLAASTLSRLSLERDHAEAQRLQLSDQARRAMQLSAGRLRAILECSADAIITYDEHLRVTLANPAAGQLMGVEVGSLIGTTPAQWLPERNRERFAAWWERLQQDPEETLRRNFRASITALDARGREITVESSLSTVQVDGRRLYVNVLRDTTEQRQMQAVLARSKATLLAALQSMPDGVCIIDAQGGLLQYNTAFIHFLRFRDREEFERQRAHLDLLLEVLDRRGQPLPPDEWLRFNPADAFQNREYRLRRIDTGQCWIGSFSFAPVVHEHGLVSGGVYTARDVTAERNASQALQNSSDNLRRLVRQMNDVEETERRRIARELHDDLQQKLAAVGLSVAAAEQTLPAAPDQALLPLRRARELTEQSIESVRRIIADLRPQILDDLGLPDALQHLLQSLESGSGLACRLQVQGPLELPTEVENSLYRITQEALNNVRKHAQAQSVSVMLDGTRSDAVELTIVDDGVGMGTVPRSPGSRRFGLLGMEERIKALGGELKVTTSRGLGLQLRVWIPLQPAHNERRRTALEPEATSA